MKSEITNYDLASLIFFNEVNYKYYIRQYNIDISNKYLIKLVINHLIDSIKFREAKIFKDHCEYI